MKVRLPFLVYLGSTEDGEGGREEGKKRGFRSLVEGTQVSYVRWEVGGEEIDILYVEEPKNKKPLLIRPS